jgi:hypothetical protein
MGFEYKPLHRGQARVLKESLKNTHARVSADGDHISLSTETQNLMPCDLW